ncbi:hypothetical protein HDU67_005589, partial [Dinochytrium kinnereticum]
SSLESSPSTFLPLPLISRIANEIAASTDPSTVYDHHEGFIGQNFLDEATDDNPFVVNSTGMTFLDLLCSSSNPKMTATSSTDWSLPISTPKTSLGPLNLPPSLVPPFPLPVLEDPRRLDESDPLLDALLSSHFPSIDHPHLATPLTSPTPNPSNLAPTFFTPHLITASPALPMTLEDLQTAPQDQHLFQTALTEFRDATSFEALMGVNAFFERGWSMEEDHPSGFETEEDILDVIMSAPLRSLSMSSLGGEEGDSVMLSGVADSTVSSGVGKEGEALKRPQRKGKLVSVKEKKIGNAMQGVLKMDSPRKRSVRNPGGFS